MTDLRNTSMAHAAPAQFSVDNHQLLLGGIPISRLSERIGQTPYYAYDRKLIRSRVDRLRSALPDSVKLHYAMKANPMPALVGFMAGLVDGIDVASAGELKTALDCGAAPVEISFAGPGKRFTELRQAVAAGVLINIESFREVELLDEISRELGLPGRVSVRINPGFELRGAGMKMGGGAKPFGVDADRVPELLEKIGKSGLEFEGFHLYCGSQNLQAQAICDAQQQSFELVCELAKHAPSPIRTINLGGGFGIPYFPGEQGLDLALIGSRLSQLVIRSKNELPLAELVLELGRFLVGEAGIYVARIVDRKISHGQVFLVVDGGLHHHLAASGNFGQVIRKNYPVAIANKMDVEASEIVSIVGPLCTPLDLLADRVALPKADIGDLVVVFQSGAYGASASPQGFLGHPAVIEALI